MVNKAIITLHAQHSYVIGVGVHIGECGSTLYLGLTGIVQNLNTKVYGDSSAIVRFFFPSGCAHLETI